MTLTTPIKNKAKLHNEVNKITVACDNVSLIPIMKPTQTPTSCVAKTPKHATTIPSQMVNDKVPANRNKSKINHEYNQLKNLLSTTATAKDREEYVAKTSYNATEKKMKGKRKILFNDDSEKLKHSQKHA